MDIVNIHNPIPILQQQKSNIFNNKDNTNPNISDIRRNKEQLILRDLVKQKQLENKSLNQNIADSFIGVINDLFTKEKKVSWISILRKNDRYYYLAILLLTIAFILIIFQKVTR